MKSKLRNRFHWGGGKQTGAFPSKPSINYASTDGGTTTSSGPINIAPVRVGTLKLDDSPVINTAGSGNGTISTMTNDRAFSQRQFNCGFDDDNRSNRREEMWYKNQTYLKKMAERGDGGTSLNVASAYISDKRWGKYDADEGSDYEPAPDSPAGVSDFHNTELDSFNEKLANRSDSETYQSSSVLDTTIADATSAYDDEGTRSTYFYSEGGTDDDDVDTTFEDVTLGTLETATWASTAAESTRYEMDDTSVRRKYKLGRGTTPHKQRPKGREQRQHTSRSNNSPPRRSRSRAYSTDNTARSDAVRSTCPFPISTELEGTLEDMFMAFSQIKNAFYISPDDIDKMSDKVRDAWHDLREFHDDYKFTSSLPSSTKRR
jgi:hypothetical protein